MQEIFMKMNMTVRTSPGKLVYYFIINRKFKGESWELNYLLVMSSEIFFFLFLAFIIQLLAYLFSLGY